MVGIQLNVIIGILTSYKIVLVLSLIELLVIVIKYRFEAKSLAGNVLLEAKPLLSLVSGILGIGTITILATLINIELNKPIIVKSYLFQPDNMEDALFNTPILVIFLTIAIIAIFILISWILIKRSNFLALSKKVFLLLQNYAKYTFNKIYSSSKRFIYKLLLCGKDTISILVEYRYRLFALFMCYVIPFPVFRLSAYNYTFIDYFNFGTNIFVIVSTLYLLGKTQAPSSR